MVRKSRGCRRRIGSVADEILFVSNNRRAAGPPLRMSRIIAADGGAQARVFVDQVEMRGGQVSKRVMFGSRTAFEGGGG